MFHPQEAPGHLFTRCPQYHHSMTVVPVNVPAVLKDEVMASKADWKTPKGWVFPGHKTMIESNKHPMKPDPIRLEELQAVCVCAGIEQLCRLRLTWKGAIV